MRAITIEPRVANSAKLRDVQEPPAADGSILVRTLALGVCGTDREIAAGDYGEAPEGGPFLILGHESLGIVEEAPSSSDFAAGDHIVGIVRRPDPVPCPACAAGEWDMCRNGRYTERGIKARHGFGAERFRIEPEFAVKVDKDLGVLAVLLEPTSIVAKAWDHVKRVGERSRSWTPKRLLVTGGGPVGLLAAMMGRQRGIEIFVADHGKHPIKAELIRSLGGTYLPDLSRMDEIKPDVVMECTGSASVVEEILGRTMPAGITCLLSVTAPGKMMQVDIGALNRTTVLDNDVILGAVNANRMHYEMAADALKRADRDWLARLITRRVALDRWQEALERQPGDIKVIVDFSL